ncbi:MAG: hypothetical protein R3268_07495 [Acidiferrobacterales bacterium]|nr:hypothetical protein [Acidiferrobacterales bacterium]
MSRQGKKEWVAPVLEKIEMSRTALICPSTGTTSKQMSVTESGMCGMGSTS